MTLFADLQIVLQIVPQPNQHQIHSAEAVLTGAAHQCGVNAGNQGKDGLNPFIRKRNRAILDDSGGGIGQEILQDGVADGPITVGIVLMLHHLVNGRRSFGVFLPHQLQTMP